MAERKQVPLEGPSMKQVNCLLATITMNHNWWLVLYMIPAQMPHSGGWLRRARLLGTMLYLPHHVLYKNTTNSKITVWHPYLDAFHINSISTIHALLACLLVASKLDKRAQLSGLLSSLTLFSTSLFSPAVSCNSKHWCEWIKMGVTKARLQIIALHKKVTSIVRKALTREALSRA